MYSYGYLFYGPITIIYAIIILLNGVIKKRHLYYYFYAILFGIYLNYLIKYAFFPIFIPQDELSIILMDFVNLNVLKMFSYTFYQIIGNILLMFPFGVLLTFITNFNYRERIFWSIITSVSVEFVQLLIIIMFHPINIIFDINDIILNLIGGVLGNIFFYLFCKVYVKIPNIKSQNSFIKYFSQICTNCANNKRSFSE